MREGSRSAMTVRGSPWRGRGGGRSSLSVGGEVEGTCVSVSRKNGEISAALRPNKGKFPSAVLSAQELQATRGESGREPTAPTPPGSERAERGGVP